MQGKGNRKMDKRINGGGAEVNQFTYINANDPGRWIADSNPGTEEVLLKGLLRDGSSTRTECVEDKGLGGKGESRVCNVTIRQGRNNEGEGKVRFIVNCRLRIKVREQRGLYSRPARSTDESERI